MVNVEVLSFVCCSVNGGYQTVIHAEGLTQAMKSNNNEK